MQRRAFLQTLAAAPALFPAQAAAFPIRIGFDTYSVRAFRWKDIQLFDYAAGLECNTLQISDSADYSSLDPAHLRQGERSRG